VARWGPGCGPQGPVGREAVVVNGYRAYLAEGGQRHRVGRGVGVTGGEGEAGGGRVGHEERGDRQAELVGQASRQGVAQDPGAAFDEDSRHGPFEMKVLEHGGQGEVRARVDDDRSTFELSPGDGDGGRPAVDQGGARAGEEAGGRVQVAGAGHGHAERLGRLSRRFAGGYPGRVADEEPRIVGADRARADQDRVRRRPQRVDLVEVFRTGQDQAVGRPVVEVAVNRDGAAQQRVRAIGHGPYATGRRQPGSGVPTAGS
jgi:hypothetical protein